MSSYSDYLKALWMGFISLPVILVIIQFLSTQLGLSRFGIFITLYKGTPLTINYIVRWLLLSESEAFRGFNFWAIILTWCVGWLFITDWVRNIKATTLGIFLTYVLYVIYVTLYHRYPLKLVFPSSFTPIIASLIVMILAYTYRRTRKTKSFFDKLREAGIEFPDIYLKLVEIPQKCGHCGALILSNSEYCWKCGEKLGKINV